MLMQFMALPPLLPKMFPHRWATTTTSSQMGFLRKVVGRTSFDVNAAFDEVTSMLDIEFTVYGRWGPEVGGVGGHVDGVMGAAGGGGEGTGGLLRFCSSGCASVH